MHARNTCFQSQSRDSSSSILTADGQLRVPVPPVVQRQEDDIEKRRKVKEESQLELREKREREEMEVLIAVKAKNLETPQRTPKQFLID